MSEFKCPICNAGVMDNDEHSHIMRSKHLFRLFLHQKVARIPDDVLETVMAAVDCVIEVFDMTDSQREKNQQALNWLQARKDERK